MCIQTFFLRYKELILASPLVSAEPTDNAACSRKYGSEEVDLVHLLRKLSQLEYKNIGVLDRIFPYGYVYLIQQKRVKIAVEFRLLMSRFEDRKMILGYLGEPSVSNHKGLF